MLPDPPPPTAPVLPSLIRRTSVTAAAIATLLVIVGGVKLMLPGADPPPASAAAPQPHPLAAAAVTAPPVEEVPAPRSPTTPGPAATAVVLSATTGGAPAPAQAPAALPAPSPAPVRRAEPLGGTYVNEHHGFSMRFPATWSVRAFAGKPWVLDSADGPAALISIGFSPFPVGFTADSISPDAVARRIKRLPDTTLHAQGYATIAGKKSLWSKSTGPLAMSNGTPRMTRVNYIVPLNDGRVMELRLAATPERFEQLMPTMRAAVSSFRLLENRTTSVTLAAGGR